MGARGGLRCEACFVICGAAITKRRVNPTPIVEHFDVLKQRPTGLLARRIPFVMRQFTLDCAEQTLRHRVVVAIAGSAHARRDLMRSHQVLT